MREDYKTKKNILIISAVFPPEPVVSASLSRDLAEELSKRNNVTVLCPTPSRPEGFKFEYLYKPENYKVFRLSSYTCPTSNIVGRFRESYSFGKYCVRYIKKNSKQIDCIYLNTWPLLAQYLVVKKASRLKIPCVVHVQDIYPESLINKIKFIKTLLYTILLPIDKYILKNAYSIISISENMKNTLIETRSIMPSKVAVVSNWQNEEAFINFRNSKDEIEVRESKPFTFMYMGNIGPLACVEFLIESFIKAEIPNSRLIIGGSGSRKKKCIELTESFKATNIEFLSVPEGFVPETQDKSDVMLLPVKKNGAMSSIPSKLPAYMFSAKPIIGSLDLESDTAKAINESSCGLIVEPENEIELIKAMKELSFLSKKDLKDKGKSGFDYAMAHFSKKANLQKVASIIENTI